MKLWLLRPIFNTDLWPSQKPNPWEPWYDKSFGFVVRADSETAARKCAADPDNAGDEGGEA